MQQGIFKFPHIHSIAFLIILVVSDLIIQRKTQEHNALKLKIQVQFQMCGECKELSQKAQIKRDFFIPLKSDFNNSLHFFCEF